MVRVLHIVLHLGYGGLERLVVDIVNRLDPDRFEGHVLALLYAGHNAPSLIDPTRLHLAGPLPRHTMLWPRALTAQIRALAPDVVHVHSGAWHKGGLAARNAGVRRVIFTEHGRPFPDRLPGRLIDGLAARRADVVVAVSSPLAEHLASRLSIDPRTITVLPNGIDVDRFRPRARTGMLARELGFPAEAPVIGTTGRLDAIKGFDVMVESLQRLRLAWPAASGPAPVLVVAGAGPEQAALEQQIRELGLTGAVHLPGWRDDVSEFLGSLDLFVLTSRSEGTSVSLLEAMSSAVCPVVNDVGGNGAVLGPELAHRLVPGLDPDTLAAAWRTALLDPEGRRTDGRAARARVEREFGLDTMVRRYEELYRAIPPTPGTHGRTRPHATRPSVLSP